jgi:hypothetical protein
MGTVGVPVARGAGLDRRMTRGRGSRGILAVGACALAVVAIATLASAGGGQGRPRPAIDAGLDGGGGGGRGPDGGGPDGRGGDARRGPDGGGRDASGADAGDRDDEVSDGGASDGGAPCADPPCGPTPGPDPAVAPAGIACTLHIAMRTESDRNVGPVAPRCSYPPLDAPPPPDAHEHGTIQATVDVPCQLTFELAASGAGRSTFHVDVQSKAGTATIEASSTSVNGSLGATHQGHEQAVGSLALTDDGTGALVGGGGIDVIGAITGATLYPDQVDKPGACDGKSDDALRLCRRANCKYQPIRTEVNGVVSTSITPIPPRLPGAIPGMTSTFTMDGAALAKGIRSGRPFAVTGTGNTRTVSGKIVVETHSTVTISVGDLSYEAILEPLDKRAGGKVDYADWVPEGPRLKDRVLVEQGKPVPGNTIAVRAYLRDKKTHKPVEGVPYAVTFTLEDVSHQPGVAMNWPPRAKADAEADLSFAAQKINGAPGTITNDGARGKTITSVASTQPAVVQVTSWDYGGYGALTAQITVDGQAPIDAKYVGGGTGRAALALPIDENHNHVADGWERSGDGDHVFARNPPPTWDRDDEPVLPAGRGDGLGLYEEYRGFVVAPMTADVEFLLRTGPLHDDLFVRLAGSRQEQNLYARAASTYEAITGIRVHRIARADRLDKTPEDGDPSRPRWLNFNDGRPAADQAATGAGAGDFGPVQAAVTIATTTIPPSAVGAEPSPGNTPFVKSIPPTSGAAVAFGAPMSVTAAQIDPASCRRLVTTNAEAVELAMTGPAVHPPGEGYKQLLRAGNAALAQAGIVLDLAKVGAAARAQPLVDTLTDEVVMFSALHELGHATGAQHHHVLISDAEAGLGDENCPMRYWNFASKDNLILVLADRWNVALGPRAGGPWKFCSVNWPTMRLHQAPGDEYRATLADP